jgi:methylglutaconyl-CoA hydratase
MTSEPIAHPLTNDPVMTGRDEDSPVVIDATQSGIVILTLNRPEKNNVLGPELVVALSDAFDTLKGADHVRGVFLRGAGGYFCAGVDPDYIAQSVNWLEDDIREDALRMAAMLKKLNDLPQLTVALVDGPAFDGGAGLVAACDLGVATKTATFAFSEVRLGLSPAAASPYVIRAVGARNAKALLATGREFSSDDALKWGLIQEVVPDARAFAPLVQAHSAAMQACAPEATADVKRLVDAFANRPIDHALMEESARRAAHRRASVEGCEGVGALLDKRKPSWAE